MFVLSEARAKCVSVNPRAEKHGDAPVVACDVNVTLDLHADSLNEFERGLSDFVFTSSAKRQRQIDGENAPDGPELRFKTLGPLKIEHECIGYSARITWGDLAGSVDLHLDEAKVHKFQAEPKEGGTVVLSFQIQAHPDTETIGLLCGLIQREVMISLTPPGTKE